MKNKTDKFDYTSFIDIMLNENIRAYLTFGINHITLNIDMGKHQKSWSYIELFNQTKSYLDIIFEEIQNYKAIDYERDNLSNI
jgi:hypothetical protein